MKRCVNVGPFALPVINVFRVRDSVVVQVEDEPSFSPRGRYSKGWPGESC